MCVRCVDVSFVNPCLTCSAQLSPSFAWLSGWASLVPDILALLAQCCVWMFRLPTRAGLAVHSSAQCLPSGSSWLTRSLDHIMVQAAPADFARSGFHEVLSSPRLPPPTVELGACKLMEALRQRHRRSEHRKSSVQLDWRLVADTEEKVSRCP